MRGFVFASVLLTLNATPGLAAGIGEAAHRFCASFVATGGQPATQAAQAKGMRFERKGRRIIGRGQDGKENVNVFAKGKGKRANCTVELQPKSRGSDGRGAGLASVMTFAGAPDVKMLSLKKGQMVVTYSGTKLNIKLSGVQVRGRITASMTYTRARK